MSEKVQMVIDLINGFNTIEELHYYITNVIDLNEYTWDEFYLIWGHMNKFDK